ncbi:response regulator [Paracraurococcus lichenis]|uniref:Response regulator n=1 Tax=Paracraurococcus lichenis TaxID=3064888 RepID=A0ABT9EDI8_9PROT|nr:response regulator [Paracraurococcus sp. LOR1-02]MDO9713955.1 response regulator [Paracraurococcus sp. LOR1-02]
MHTKHVPHHCAVLRGRRVLVVEREALTAMLITGSVRDAGAEVIGPAFAVSEALELIECAEADGGLSAAVLNIDFQGTVVSPITDRLAALGVPFVVAIGYNEGSDCEDPAAAPVLVKPFSPDVLVAATELMAALSPAARANTGPRANSAETVQSRGGRLLGRPIR